MNTRSLYRRPGSRGLRFTLCMLAAGLLTIGSAARAEVSFTFTKIAESGDPMPGHSGSFGTIYQDVALDRGRVVFYGVDSVGLFNGVYTWHGNVLQVVADENTAIPDGQDMFGRFGATGGNAGVAVSGENIAFRGISASLTNEEGVYRWSNDALTMIVDLNSPLPGGTGDFTGFLINPDLQGADAAFEGNGTIQGGVQQHGLYTRVGNTLVNVVDRNTAVPGGTENFWSFNTPFLDGGNVVFQGEERYSFGMEGIYSVPVNGGAVTTLVDETTVAPDGSGTLGRFGRLSLSGSDLAFGASTSTGSGGMFTLIGGIVRHVVRVNDTVIPGTSDRFGRLGPFVSFSNGSIAFQGSTASFEHSGVYSDIGGELVKVIAEGDALDGKSWDEYNISSKSMSGNQILIYARSWDDETNRYLHAIYLATASGEGISCSAGVVDSDGDGLCDDVDWDDDNDGMPDEYELSNGLDQLQDDAAGDLDGDGVTNLREYQRGTRADDPDDHPPVPDLDFFHDGASDVLLRDAVSGVWQLYDVDDLAAAPAARLGVYRNLRWRHRAAADLDGDGDEDILVRHVNGDWYRFIVEDGAVVGGHVRLAVFRSDRWRFAAVLDADGDGDDDILLRHTELGQWRLFVMENGAVQGQRMVRLFTSDKWTIRGVGDYDGDGDDDVLLRQDTLGFFRLFLFGDGDVERSADPGRLLRQPHWLFVSSGDLDGDGTTDVIQRHRDIGVWQACRFVDGMVEARHPLGIPLTQSWTHRQTDDFDADGDDDILLRNDVNGRWRFFSIEAFEVQENRFPNLPMDLNFEIRSDRPGS